jgi:hypothetical protein
MHCTSCGNTLPPETAVCYDCGASTPYNVSSSNNPSSYDTLPVADGPFIETSSAPDPPQGPHQQNPFIEKKLDKATTDYEIPAIKQPQVTTAPQPLYAAPQALTPQQPPLQHMTTPGQQYPRQNSGLSHRMMISLVLVSLLILLSGVGLILYASVLHPAQLRAQATSTAQMQLTMAARATAQANAQATGTAQALAHATATAQARATAQAAATATALQSIYNQATSGNPLLDVALDGQDSLNWEQYPAVGGGGCSFFGGALHANVPQKDYYVPCFAQASNFSNFTLQVQMTIDKGDGGGLVFRANSTSSKFYIFSIVRDGTYGLLISLDDNHSNPLTYGNSSAIHTNLNQTNLLTVIARGSYIYLYVNKQYAGSVTDNTYTSGQIGVFGADNANPTDVAFSHIQIWNL